MVMFRNMLVRVRFVGDDGGELFVLLKMDMIVL